MKLTNCTAEIVLIAGDEAKMKFLRIGDCVMGATREHGRFALLDRGLERADRAEAIGVGQPDDQRHPPAETHAVDARARAREARAFRPVRAAELLHHESAKGSARVEVGAITFTEQIGDPGANHDEAAKRPLASEALMRSSLASSTNPLKSSRVSGGDRSRAIARPSS